MEKIHEIIAEITEKYETPIRLGSRCESKVFYRVEDLSDTDVLTCADYIAERIMNVCSPNLPQVLINLPGSETGLAEALSVQLAPQGEQLLIIQADSIKAGSDALSAIRGTNVCLVNDVITTGISCLETHTKATLAGATVLCWASLIDRTFGPGPVPVAASFTGAPIRLIK